MITALALALGLFGLSPAEPCRFDGAPSDWTAQALEAWDRLDHQAIGMANALSPLMVLFDQGCVYILTPSDHGEFVEGARRYSASAEPHAGEIWLPGGEVIPARKTSFAGPLDEDGMFFVMALPDVWRSDTAERRDPEQLAMVVFMHEFAHTQQPGLADRVGVMIQSGLAEDLDDDALQRRWQDTPEYLEAYRRERDLLYAAAEATDQHEAFLLLEQARDAMAARRSRFLGDAPLWREADSVFLSFEGAGNWAAWRWLMDPQGGGLTPSEATAFVRGSGRWWSQEQGLALMQALDRVYPQWPAQAFGPASFAADELIALALANGRRPDEQVPNGEPSEAFSSRRSDDQQL